MRPLPPLESSVDADSVSALTGPLSVSMLTRCEGISCFHYKATFKDAEGEGEVRVT